MIDVVFVFLVFLAVIAVIGGIRPDVMLAGALFIFLWEFVQFLGPSLFFAAYVISLAACVRLMMTWVFDGPLTVRHKQAFLRFIDAALSQQRRRNPPEQREQVRYDQDKNK